MINYLQAIILGLLQGATELFPVSSLGNSVILPAIFGWNINQSDPFFLIFLVATHFATALALLAFFCRDWILIVKGFFASFFARSAANASRFEGDEGKRQRKYASLAWLIILGTVPAGIVGLIFQTKLQALFASPRLVAVFLILNGIMLWGIEKFYSGRHPANAHTDEMHEMNEMHEMSESDGRIARLTLSRAVKVGLSQCLALIPGFSRTGATQGGGILVGLSREDAARFAFLLATPIIFAAAVLKLPQLGRLVASQGLHILGPIFAGSLCAFVAAYFSARFLVKYFKTKTLMPFAIYCMAAGALATVALLIR